MVEEIAVASYDDDDIGLDDVDADEPELLDGIRRPSRQRPSAAWLRDWVMWFGPVRLVACAVALVAVAVAGWWLVRSPPEPTEAALPVAGSDTAAGSESTPTASGVAGGADAPAAGAAGNGAAANSASGNGVTEASASGPMSGSPPGDSMESAEITEVVVHVTGAVRQPGVYRLTSDMRLHDAIELAGGFTKQADTSALNLAATLVDGSQVYVPKPGEEIPVAAAPAPDPAQGGGPAGTPTGGDDPLVNVNTADQSELETLPGIGPVTAQAIIDHRESAGWFATVDDLEGVRGIGPATLDAIYDLVTV